MKITSTSWLKKIFLLLAAGLLAGAGIQAFLPPREGFFVVGWLASTALLVVGAAGLYLVWKAAGGGRLLAWMVALAFLLRLGSGVALSVSLPVLGHDTVEELAGHIFSDAYKRDQAAWDLAKSGSPLFTAFTQDFASDQYGGLLAMSAGVYRTMSPDAHRPYLIQILAALAAALGVPFFWAAARRLWGNNVTRVAAWIMVLYPESILLGGYQMREPFLISLAAIAFWAVVTWPERKTRTLLVFGGSVVGLFLLSSRVALPVVSLCLLWLWIDQIGKARTPSLKMMMWVGLAAVIVAIVGLAGKWLWNWLFLSGSFDIQGTIRNSGILESLIPLVGDPKSSGMQLFVIGYGIAQPVLPAAIFDPKALPIYQVIGIFRALGWYMLIPILTYSAYAVWKAPAGKERRVLVLMAAADWVWVVISSIRGGGDQWDNPRYRAIFLPWLALLAGWACTWARAHRDPWFWRSVAVVGIFVLVFSEWYLSRMVHFFPRPSFEFMAISITGLSLLVLAGGWYWDFYHKRRGS